MPFRRSWCGLFRIAFDVYLEVLDRVDKQVDSSLNRDDEDWRIKNICPCCSYELEDEPELRYKKLFCIDGNNSLKSVDDLIKRGIPRADSRGPRRDIWISRDDVDKFENEEITIINVRFQIIRVMSLI